MWAIIEALETFALGSALAEANNGQNPEIPPEYGSLHQAVAQRTTLEENFEIGAPGDRRRNRRVVRDHRDAGPCEVG